MQAIFVIATSEAPSIIFLKKSMQKEKTRASAQWGTDTPGQRHFLMYKTTQNQWNISHCGLL